MVFQSFNRIANGFSDWKLSQRNGLREFAVAADICIYTNHNLMIEKNG